MLEEYIHYFETEQEYNDYVNSSAYTEPFISTHFNSNSSVTVNYNIGELKQPLTFEIVSGGTLYWRCMNTGVTKTIEYKKNDGEWTSITSSQDNDGSGTTISTVVAGDIIQFRGNNNIYATNMGTCNNFVQTQNCYYYVYGNIMSLLNASNYKTNKTFTVQNSGIFQGMFIGNTALLSHPEKQLLLPATTIIENCYKEMFNGCTSLTTAPELPATTLANYCYYYMFYNCTGLTTAPELPATTLANYCYQFMFYNCTSLTTAPELPATTLVNYCYGSMFKGCTNLTIAPELPAFTLANSCYQSMFENCTNLTIAPVLPATALTQNCYYAMFQGCTGLTTAPELSAETVPNYAYSQMFRECSNINYIKCLATDISAPNSTLLWTDRVSSTGTFVKNPNMTIGEGGWSTGNNGIPTNWTVEDAS